MPQKPRAFTLPPVPGMSGIEDRMSGMLDMRPTTERPLVHQDDPVELDAALQRAAQLGIDIALPLGLAGAGGPAGLLRNLPPALIQSILGPMSHPDPNLLLGEVGKPGQPPLPSWRWGEGPAPSAALAEQQVVPTSQELALRGGPTTEPTISAPTLKQFRATPDGRLLVELGAESHISPEQLRSAFSGFNVTVSKPKGAGFGTPDLQRFWVQFRDKTGAYIPPPKEALDVFGGALPRQP